MDVREPAYLSIVRMPQAMEREELVSALAAEAGTDPYYARQRLAKGLPAVVQRIDAAEAPRIVAALKARGIPAIAPTATELRDIAPAIAAKRLAPALGAPEPMFLCEPWRTEPFGFRAADIVLLVRGRVPRTERGPAREQVTGVYLDPLTGMIRKRSERVRDEHFSISELLDVYLRDRRRIRCDGDKFSFDFLGPDRGLTDNENMDKLGLLLAESAPKAIVDVGFSSFSAPSGILSGSRTTSSGKAVRDTHPVFDFYSPWILFVYRAQAARER